MGYLRDTVFLLVSLVGGLQGVVLTFYIYVFVMNIHIPGFQVPTVDGNPHCGPLNILSSPLWNNLLLLSIFIFQHSFTMRGPVRKVLDIFLKNEEQFRVTYMLGACGSLGSVFVFWMPMPYEIWNIQQQELRMTLTGLSFVSFIGMVYSLHSLDALNLYGIKPLLEKMFKWKRKKVQFVITGPYGLIRHPVYIFLFLTIWITPSMSVGHAFYSCIITVYTMLAVAYLEEPDLVRKIGPQYVEYMQTTPRYVPRLCPVNRKLD